MLAIRSDLLVEVVEISTKGDEDKTSPLSVLGSKGVFAHELQVALADGRIDVAVHSTKDLTDVEPPTLELGAFLERADPADVLVSRSGASLADLPSGCTVGTSSIRRQAQLRQRRPDLVTVPLRGNVDTRLRKVAGGEVDAAILAAAGVLRLGRGDEITERLDPEVFVPSPGQGAIALERRRGDLAWLDAVDHRPTRTCVEAERTFMRLMEGSCELPLGAFARGDGDAIVCVGFVDPDTAEVRGPATDPTAVGRALADRFLGGVDRPG